MKLFFSQKRLYLFGAIMILALGTYFYFSSFRYTLLIEHTNDELMSVATAVNEHYVKFQKIPSLEEINLPLPPYLSIHLAHNGTILARTDDIQANSYIQYYPQRIKNSIFWSCYTNLKVYRPDNCVDEKPENLFSFYGKYALGAEFDNGNLFYEHQYFEAQKIGNTLVYTPKNHTFERITMFNDQTLYTVQKKDQRVISTYWFNDDNTALVCQKAPYKLKAHLTYLSFCYPTYLHTRFLTPEIKEQYLDLRASAQALERGIKQNTNQTSVLFHFFDAQARYSHSVFKQGMQTGLDKVNQYYLQSFEGNGFSQ